MWLLSVQRQMSSISAWRKQRVDMFLPKTILKFTVPLRLVSNLNGIRENRVKVGSKLRRLALHV